ncbi:hypothetical protein SCHPADRAFT_946221 [Schizopora paradoxa]|uniref:Uncharacterized protein n=1 Tax=Schizopora paradoxa TaxID=27342 RepID=A0A0H2RN59_9AGAM|nr:hypothetical protein SCHPADRAFT_946221 [Schizopora paradoxa]
MVLFLRGFERSPGSPERVTRLVEDFPESALRTPQGHTSVRILLSPCRFTSNFQPKFPSQQFIGERSPQAARCEPVRSCCAVGDTPNSLRFIGSSAPRDGLDPWTSNDISTKLADYLEYF